MPDNITDPDQEPAEGAGAVDNTATATGATRGTTAQERSTPTTTGEPSADTKPDGDDEPKFTQAQLNKFLADDRKREAEKHAKKLEAEAEEKKRAEKKARGDYELLLQEEQEKNRQLEAEYAGYKRQILCGKIAARHKLPEQFISRLQGETEEEINADAASMAKELKPLRAPDPEGGPRDGSTREQALKRARMEAQSSSRYAPM